MQLHEGGGAKGIASADKVDPVRRLVQHCVMETTPRQALLEALQRCARAKAEISNGADRIIEGLADSEDLPWITAATYSRLRRKENSLPDGTVFTPPWLANHIVDCLLPDLPVVDLGAGSGMLALTAAKRGFRVIAIEQDPELAAILDSLARIMKLQGLIEVRVGDALSYSRRSEGQIMANPPFTRHHSIPAEKKQWLTELVRKLGVTLPLTTGYYGYFMAYAWRSTWSKREVLLLPTNWLETRYGQPLRALLLTRGHKLSLVENGYHTPVFEHALTNICLVETQPIPSVDDGFSRRVQLQILTPPKVAMKEANGFQQTLVPRFNEKTDQRNEGRLKIDHVVSDVFKVKRGIATGDNQFFVLPNKPTKELGLPPSELVVILRRLSTRPRSKDLAYLWVPGKVPSSASRQRMIEGENLGVNRKYLCEHRKFWWRVDVPSPPAYFLSYMGRDQPRILRNRNRLLNLNNIHGLYIQDGVTNATARKVARWLGSKRGAMALLNHARHYYGGMWKLEPGDVERLKLPDTLRFGNTRIKRSVDKMYKVCKSAIAQLVI